MSLGTFTSIEASAGFPARGLVFMTFWSPLVLQVRNFGQTAAMTLGAAESRDQKCLNQFPGECVADYEPSEADHIQIVVLDALVR
jgi:hypothetical protein